MEPSAASQWTWHVLEPGDSTASEAQPRKERAKHVPADTDTAVALLAHAFASDPFYRWLFAREPEERRAAALARLFRVLVRGRRLRVHVHMDGARCLVAALDEPPDHRPRWTTTLAVLPGLAWAMLLGAWPRPWRLVTATRVLIALARRRPKTSHLHLALVAVTPEARGTGLGKAAVEALLREAEGRLHLETSRPENRGFYARLGLVESAAVERGGAPTVWVFLGSRRPGVGPPRTP